MIDNDRHFNIRQRNAFARVVADNFGAHMQTGFWHGEDGLLPRDHPLEGQPALWVQMGPNLPLVTYVIDENGQVHER